MSTTSGKDLGNGLQAPLEAGSGNGAVAGFDGRRFALDVGQDAGNLIHLLLHLRLQPGYAIMGFLQAEPFVEFNVLLHVQSSAHVLHADVVHVQIVAGGDRADAVEEAFLAAGASASVDHDIGVGQQRTDPRLTLRWTPAPTSGR